MLSLKHFPNAVPPRPMGSYAHIILLRETDSYALFQTDGELNTARVRAGLVEQDPMTRLTIFKRKQTTPERLVGRELLRRYEIISGEAYDEKAKSAVDKAGAQSATITCASVCSVRTVSAMASRSATVVRKSRRCLAIRPTASRPTILATSLLRLMRPMRVAV